MIFCFTLKDLICRKISKPTVHPAIKFMEEKQEEAARAFELEPL